VKTFQVDEASSDDERMYIDILSRASVCINVTDEGIIIDVWAAKVEDAPAATLSVTWDEVEDPS